jgi:transposase-like protein
VSARGRQQHSNIAMPNLTPEAWAQIRADYEHTDRPIEDICAEHGISSGTLRDRMRRWTRRRQPIPLDGPPPLPAPPAVQAAPRPAVPTEADATALPAEQDAATTHSDVAAAPPTPADVSPALIAQRLQGAVARVLPAIEATLGRIAGGTTHPRELENAARALGSLTRTLRELNALLAQHAPPKDEGPQTLEEYRAQLIRKMDAIIAARPTEGDSDPLPPAAGDKWG